MKLIPRHRTNRSKLPRIAISQAEITADLHYPATRAAARGSGGERRPRR